MEEFSHLFEGVADPRRSNATLHDLDEMLMIGLLSSLCGGEGCTDMERFGRAREKFLRSFMRLPHGIPSHDAFTNLFNALDPGGLQRAMLRLAEGWAAGLGGEVVAIDGKALRRSFADAASRSPLHLVQAFASEARLVLGQVRVAGKSNEITALPALLEMLALKGRIVTADAMHTQRETARAVTAAGGDYVLALKGNQGTLYEDAKLYLDDPAQDAGRRRHRDTDGGHGRIETRTASVAHDIDWLQERHGWPGLAAIGKVVATRETRTGTTTETRYYIISAKLSPERFQHAVRSHWAIENSLHWVLDVTMNEDRQRNRTGNGPENLALLRRMALNVARIEPGKDAMRGKLKRAGWDNNFLLDMIRSTKTHNPNPKSRPSAIALPSQAREPRAGPIPVP